MEPTKTEDENPSTNNNNNNNNNNNKPSTGPANASDKIQKLSLINRKFLSGQYFEPPPERDNFIGFRSQYFFLYGSLMDPRQLRKVLRIPETPALQSASIVR
jgi:hypothetical protein